MLQMINKINAWLFFSVATLQSQKICNFIAGGGLLIGFGTRYAGGCTSGHTISRVKQFTITIISSCIGFSLLED